MSTRTPGATPREYVIGMFAVAGIIAVVIAIALAIVIPEYHDPAVRWTAVAAVLTGGAFLVGLVGLPVAVWQLLMVQLEQERIAAQLVAKPKIEMGFVVPGEITLVEDERTVFYSEIGHSVQVPLCAVNVGERTAHNPRLTVTFPEGYFEIQPSPSVRAENVDGVVQITAQDDVLNPQGRREILFGLTFLPDTPYVLRFVCRCFSQDAPALKKIVTLRFEHQADA